MNEQLKELLLIEYGTLLFDYDNSKDYFYMQVNISKRNAINTLLEVPLIDK
jgi:hypothetical protein